MSLRLFAALDPPDDVADQILSVQHGAPGAHWRPRENLHITLRFFGEVREDIARDLDSALEEAAQAAAPFELALKGAGAFGKAEPHTLWIGLAPSPALARLAASCERVARSVGLAPETRKFAPHLTIASVEAVAPDIVRACESRLGLFASRPWLVDRLFLYSSWVRRGEPSLYRQEAEYPFLG